MNEVLPPLTPDAQALLQQSSLWATRRQLDHELHAHFTALEAGLAGHTQPLHLAWPAGIDPSRGRTARGEDYLGHPYRLLDYPRNYQGQPFMVLRCLVVWGLHASAHLILKGPESLPWRQALVASGISAPAWGGWGLHQGPDPWTWQPDQCLPLPKVNPHQWQEAQGQDLWRLSRYWPLTAYPACWAEVVPAWAAACQAWGQL